MITLRRKYGDTDFVREKKLRFLLHKIEEEKMQSENLVRYCKNNYCRRVKKVK